MTCVPVAIVGGRPRPWVSAAGSERQAERACAVLAKSYREVHLVRHPVGKPETAETVGTWRDGKRVA